MIYDVTIEPLGLMALFDLKSSPAALSDWCGTALPDFPETPLGYTVKDGMELMYLGPEHWLLRAPLDMEEALSNALKPDAAPDDISIVRVSDTLTFFSISGPERDEVMAVATPLDLHPTVFPDRCATYTEAFSAKSLILRSGEAYHLGVDRSYGAMIADYLARTVAG